MKRTALTTSVCLMCILLLASACRQTGQQPAAPNAAPADSAATPAVAGGCTNPYFPVGPQTKREYRTTFSKGTLPASVYTETFSDFTDDGFTQHQQFDQGGVKIDRAWRCSSAGVSSQEYADLGVSNTNFKFKTLASEGVIFPAAGEWRQGATWDYSFDVSGEGRTGAGTNGPTISTAGAIKVHNEIVGKEQVTVPAGTFDAWKVRTSIAQNMNTKMNNMSVPTNLTITSEVWFAEGTGMVKSESKDFGARTELISAAR